jgi:RNA 2',3'-cyclic 3'-phosphodiesterase
LSEPARRLFFALWPDAAARAELAAAARAAIVAAGGRAVPESNLHATLAFLGSVPEPRLGELREIAARVACGHGAGARPLRLHFDEVAHWARPQILVAVSAVESPAAHALAGELKSATHAAGFSPDLKPFQAHVTLARKVSRAAAAPLAHRVSWSFGGFALVESRTDARGAAYSVVESFLLVAGQNSHGEPRN